MKIISLAIKKLYGFFRYCAMIIPVGNVVMFESLNDYDGNARAVYDYLVQNGYSKKYKFVWAARNLENIPNDGFCDKIVCLGRGVKNLFYENRARYVFFDNRMPVARKRKKATYVYLTHGCPFLKNPKGIIVIDNLCDKCLCTSINLQDFVSEYYTVRKDKIIFAGLPRNDIFFQPVGNEFEKISNRKFSKKFIWMPTFRQFKYLVNGQERNDSENSYFLGLPIISSASELQELNEYLKKNDSCLIIKFHPGAKLELEECYEYENIFFVKPDEIKYKDLDVYGLFKETDMLISDYSSVVFDYMLLNKPIGYIIDDIDGYKLGFAFQNILEQMPGHHINNFEELLKCFDDVVNEKDIYGEWRRALCDKYQQFQDGNNAERIAKMFF